MLLEHKRPVHVFSGQFSDANLVIEFSNSNICKAGTGRPDHIVIGKLK